MQTQLRSNPTSQVQEMNLGFVWAKTISERTWSISKTRYDFNGKETDQESGYQDYGFRDYDVEICRFLQVDPLHGKYPWNATYCFAENDVMRSIDLDGLEKLVVSDVIHPTPNKPGSAKITVSLTYYLIDKGPRAFNGNIDEKEIRTIFAKSENLQLTKLPIVGVPSEGKPLEEQLPEKRTNESLYYNINFVFDIKIVKGNTYEQAVSKLKEDKYGNGLIGVPTDPNMKYGDERKAIDIFKLKPGALEASHNNGFYNTIWFAPDVDARLKKFSHMLTHNEIVVHGFGHNALKRFSDHELPFYKYTQKGMQSNSYQKVYPTADNLFDMLKANFQRITYNNNTTEPKNED